VIGLQNDKIEYFSGEVIVMYFMKSSVGTVNQILVQFLPWLISGKFSAIKLQKVSDAGTF